MNLRPGEYFTVVRQLHDHADNTTRYVRAVIRNARTDDVIDTLELTDRGDRRFSKEWQVPADPSGQGFYISILTTIYDDSGFTTKSENYGEEMNTYLVDKRNEVLGGWGGGDVDYKRIARIIGGQLKKIFPNGYSAPERADFSGILKGFELISAALNALEDGGKTSSAASSKRTEEHVAAIIAALSASEGRLIERIGGIKETDISGLTSELQKTSKTIESLVSAFTPQNLAAFKAVSDRFPELSESFKKIEGGVRDFLLIMEKHGVKSPFEKRAAELAGRA